MFKIPFSTFYGRCGKYIHKSASCKIVCRENDLFIVNLVLNIIVGVLTCLCFYKDVLG